MSMGSQIMKNGFAERFEPLGDGYLFRDRPNRPGYALTAAERDRFVADFSRRVGWMTAILFVVIMAICVGGAGYAVANNVELSQGAIMVVVVMVLAISIAINMWFWAAPLRALQGRTPDVAALPKAAAGREQLRQLSWKRLVWYRVGAAVLCIWLGYTEDPTFSGWARLWLVGAAALLTFAAVQAFRKWQLERKL